jgi:hypothetical protein
MLSATKEEAKNQNDLPANGGCLANPFFWGDAGVGLVVDLFPNPQLMEQCRTSNSIVHFQQITGTLRVGFLERSHAGVCV